MIKIAACLIVKDETELNKLRKSVGSLIDYVDDVFITETGNTASDLIESFCAHNGLHYSYFKWNDSFADARNFNFEQAGNKYDYIYWQDADDILVGGHQLKEIAQQAKDTGKDLVFFSYWYGCTFNGEPSSKTLVQVDMDHPRERLIKPGSNIWKGRLHETPVPTKNLQYVKYLYEAKERPVAVMHTATDTDVVEHLGRNQRILEIQLKEEREQEEADPRTLLYLMKIYAQHNTEEYANKVLEMGKEYLEKSGWDQERGTCYEQMGIAYETLKDDLKAIDCYHKAKDEWPYQVLYYIRLATAYFRAGQYQKAEHWMNLGSKIDIGDNGTDFTNLKAMKIMYSELLFNMHYSVKKDIKKALEAMKLLCMENPTENNEQMLQHIMDLNDLNEACEKVDKVAQYLYSIGEPDSIIKMLDVLPRGITTQPFAINLRKKFTPSRMWGTDEICYFANFGTKHFEPWGPSSLAKGIGGSETAVIELSKELAKRGFKVTVYGDPEQEQGTHEGVTYLPWYYFNAKDFFNIVIQWRSWQLADKIKCRKFYVDLHDVVSELDLNDQEQQAIDGIMFKSNYHRAMMPKLEDSKAIVIGNGIRI